MSYFKKLKKSTRRTRFLLALLTLLFGFSANAALQVSASPVNPSTLADDAKVVMYHNSTGKLVGCNGGNEVTKDSKEITDADAKYYVFTIKKNSEGKIYLRNSAGYVPQVTGSGRNYNAIAFNFSW